MTTTKRKTKSKTPKSPVMRSGTFTKALFIRCNEELLAKLDAHATGESAKVPGRRVSRADAARELLSVALGMVL